MAIAMMLLVGSALSLAADLAEFEGGPAEVIASLDAPGFEATVNITVPADFRAGNATMKVMGMAAESNASAYPENVVMTLNGTTIWAFQQTGFGPLGRQDSFWTGQKQLKTGFGIGGGVNTAYIRLPAGADVKSASVELKGIPATDMQELVNFTGEATNDTFGVSADAGDVNGDGFDDVIVGACNNDAGGECAGRAYVFFGNASMDNTPDVIMTGGVARDAFGFSVSSAGDVNNDGYDDVIVGAPYDWSNTLIEPGRAYIFYGGKNVDNGPDVVFTGAGPADAFGWSVSGAGDVNGDDIDDVIVCAPFNDSGGDNKGRAYIYLGGANMDGTPDVIMTGASAYDRFGMGGVSDAGDVNGDGFDDVIVGGRYKDAFGAAWARAFLFYGNRSMDDTADLILTAQESGDDYGCSVSGAGDVNGDGYDDVIVGEDQSNRSGFHAGRADIFYGGKHMDESSDVTFYGAAAHDSLGKSVSGAGDVDKDGYDDAIVGAYTADFGIDNTGEAYIYYGGNGMDSIADVTLKGANPWDYYGGSVSGAGDVNGDKYDEVTVGARSNDAAGQDAGRVYLYSLALDSIDGPQDPGIAIAKNAIWNATGNFNITGRTEDFSTVLNKYLGSASASGNDTFGNCHVTVPIDVSAKSAGAISLFNLSIVYQYTATVPNFACALNDYIMAHEDKNNSSGNISVPLKIRSQSAGRIKLSGLELAPARPPVLVKEIGNAEIDEDSWNMNLIDLYLYFESDSTPDSAFCFSIVSRTNSSFVALGIARNRYLAANAFDGDANDNWTGTVEVVVACEDRLGQRTESNRFSITVRNVNDEPVITSAPGTVADPGILYYYNVTASDGDNDRLKFSLPTAPLNMTIDDGTGRIQWLPRAGGDHAVTVAVSDGIATTEQSFVVTVPNRPPRITSEPPQNATTGVIYVYNVTAEDDNDDTLVYSLGRNIDGMDIDRSNGMLTWVPSSAEEYYIIIRVSDGKAAVEQKFMITAAWGNRAPRFTSVPVKTATIGMAYAYQAKAVDDDKDRLTFSLVENPAGMAIDGASGKVSWTPATPGDFVVKITVNDGKGGEANQEFVIKVAGKVRPKVEITWPPDGEKVMGTVVITGTALKGTYDIACVEVRLDGGNWTNAPGEYKWQYKIDTTKLKNGLHKVEARAFDGKDHSDLATCNFTVANQKKEQAKGFIPGLTGVPALLVIVAGAVLFARRRHRTGGGAG